MERKFEVMLIQKKAELDVATHEDPSLNNLFNRVTDQGSWRIKHFADRQFYVIQGLFEVIVASGILLFFNWWVFLVVLIGTLPELFAEIKYGRGNWSLHAGRDELRRKFWEFTWHFNFLPNLVELKIFQNTKNFLNKISDLFKIFHEEEKLVEKRRLTFHLCTLILSQLVIAFSIFFFTTQVVKGVILIGTLVFVLSSVSSFRSSLSGLFLNIGRQYQDSLFVSDVFSMIELKPRLSEKINGVLLDQNKSPEIIFDKVTFRYPGTKEDTLKNFSLKISPGEKIALVGVNGAGKTTFVKLLCRFYDPTEGKITINGHDLRDIDLQSWYYILGVIFQDYAKYHLEVKDAIALGRSSGGLSIDLVKESAQASEADIFIEEWENKYDQMLGKEFTGGVEPSIGQWQKLALAKAFYRNPHVLILDEPTSSIDAVAEAKIFEKLEKTTKERTVIFISHRFSTVRKADKIVVIENGEITEVGSHKKLLDLNKTYAKLFRLQAKEYL